MRRSMMSLASLCVACLSLAEPAGAARYVFATFKGDRAPGEKLSIYDSTDALNFSLVSDTGFAGSSGTLRDPSILKYRDGKYYVAHTNPPTESCCGKADHFSIATSADLVNWTELTTVASRVPGVAHTWAPEWFVDDGVVRIIASIDTLDNDTDFRPYVFTATNAALTEWSAPVPLGFGPNYIDTFVVKSGGVYHAFTKQESTRFLEHATAPSLTGPWTFIGVGNWSGFGAGMEGPNLVRLDDGTWRLFLDGQGSVGFLHAESADLVTWSRAQPLPGLSDLVRHGTIIRDAVDDSLVDAPPADADPALPGPELPDAAVSDNMIPDGIGNSVTGNSVTGNSVTGNNVTGNNVTGNNVTEINVTGINAGSDAGPAGGLPVEPTRQPPSGGFPRGDSTSAPSGAATGAVTPAGGASPDTASGVASGTATGAASDARLNPAAGRSSGGGCDLTAPRSASNPWSWVALAGVMGVLRKASARAAKKSSASVRDRRRSPASDVDLVDFDVVAGR